MHEDALEVGVSESDGNQQDQRNLDVRLRAARDPTIQRGNEVGVDVVFLTVEGVTQPRRLQAEDPV